MAKKTKEKMTEDELISLCEAEFNDAIVLTTEIQNDRERSMQYYNTEPFGNEEDGLSKFVSSDVRDAVEWLMPQLVDIFVGGDTPIVFEPENAEDVEDAETESRYCQYIFERKNAGTILTIQWIKDALLLKNGIVKAWAEESVKHQREEYKGKTGQEYLALSTDKEFEIKEATIELGGKEYSEDEYMKLLAAMPEYAQTFEAEAKYNVIGYRTKPMMNIMIENVPPEQFFVQRNHNSLFLKDSRYCGEYYEKTRSELIELGYDKDLVMGLPASTGVAEVMGSERQMRHKREGGLSVSPIQGSGDRSRELVMVYDHYIRADFDGDGISELRHVRTGGKGADYILENEEVDRNIYHAITPYINNYRFFGRSVADNLMDLQRMKSQLWRNAMDNISYSAIPRNVVKGNVDINALMTYVQGGVIKGDLNSSVEPLVTPFVADSALAMADKVDMIRAERSGFSKETMGLNPDALANSNNPVAMMIMSQSQLLTKMIATIIANSGFKTMMEHIRELVLKYEDQEKVFDLTGTWMKTDPRRWQKERSSVPRVGVGFAGKQEELAALERVFSLQEKFILAQGGSLDGALTNSTGIYNTVKRFCRRMGIKDAETYFQNPAEYQPPPPRPDIQQLTLQANVETVKGQQTIEEAKIALDLSKQRDDKEIKQAELEQKERLAMKEIESKERLAELELIYKYGKDASDRHASIEAKAFSDPDRDEKTERGMVKVNVGDPKKAIKKMAADMRESIGNLQKATTESNEQLLKAITAKKKIKVNRDKDGFIQEVEQ